MRAIKKLFTLISVLLFFAVLALPSLAVTYSFVSVSGYTPPTTVTAVSTSNTDADNKIYPWTYADGELISGNAKKTNSLSILKITVTGSGAVTFRYKVSSGTTKNSFLVSTADGFLDNVKSGYTALDNNKVGYDRVYGEIDWTWKTVTIDADETEQTDVYLAYRTAGTTCKSDDVVEIKNLTFSTGEATVTAKANNSALGSVTGSGEYLPGSEVTLTATPNAGNSFYCWVSENELVSFDSAYTFEAADDAEITAMFGKTDETVALNLTTGSIFSSVTAALNEAKADENVWLLSDTALTENTVIPNNVTLCVPYRDDYHAACTEDGTTANSPTLATDGMVFRTLTVPTGITLKVEGTLRLGGVIGYPAQIYQGHTSGAYGKIRNDGEITVESGAVLDCYGFITGDGKVNAKSGATVYEPFIVYDFSGGSNTLELVKAQQSPFTQYTMQNIRCALVMHYGSALMGRCNLYASSQFNKTDAIIIGDAAKSGILQLKEGATLTRTVNLTEYCPGYCTDLGRVTFDVTGGAAFRALTMKVMGVEVSTKDVLFPLIYGSRFRLADGGYAIDTGIVLMPGAEMTVAEDAELLVKQSFFVLDGLVQDELSGKSYPTSELLASGGFSTGGTLTVNGKLTIADSVRFGGIVQSRKVGATVQTSPAKDSTEDFFSNTITIGGKAAYGDNTSVVTLDARVYDGEKLIKLEPNKTYTFRSVSSWKLDSYRIDQYVKDGTECGPLTVTVNSTMYGSLKEETTVLLGDLNGDGYVNSKDATRLAKYLAELVTLDETELACADVNGDGYVNSKDATRLAKYLAELIPSLSSL